MAGRKPPSEPNFFSTLLGKLGLERQAPPKAKKASGGKRRRKRRPDEADAAYAPDGFPPEGDAEASPFADYDAHGGLMEPSAEGGEFADALSYEAAAAAGYAPPAPSLPKFGGLEDSSPAAATSPPRGEEPARPAPSPLRGEVPAGGEGKLFSVDALDNSLDALFSGLETGMAPPPIPPTEPSIPPMSGAPEPAKAETPLFDEFGLTPPKPVADEPEPAPAPTAARSTGGGNAPEARDGREGPRPIHKPIVTEPAPAAPAASAPPPPTPPNTPIRDVERAPTEHVAPAPIGMGFRLPPPEILPLAVGVNLNALLATIDRTSGVAGSLVVGYDGLIIASSLPSEIDPDYLGAQATNLFMGNRGQLEKMRRGELRRIILETASGAMLVTAADMGILVVVSHEGRAMDIGGVMAAIGGALGQA